MSREAAMAFLKEVAKDSELQRKLLAFAKEQGYEFSGDELSDADLTAIAGGILARGDATRQRPTSLTIGGPGDSTGGAMNDVNFGNG